MQQQNAPVVRDKDDDEIDLLQLFGTLLDQKWLIAGITAFFLIVGVAYALLATPIYRSNAMIQVEAKKGSMTMSADMNELFGSESQAVTEIALIKSRAVLGKTVDNLKLNIIAEPHHLPILGDFLARRFQPEQEGDIAEPLLGMDSYAWGGEELKIFQLDVPSYLLGKELTLVAGESGSYTLYDDDDNLLVEGKVGAPVEGNGVTVQVETLKARPGTHFDVMRERRLTTILRYQDALEVSEQGKDSGIISMALESDDPQAAIQILDEIGQLYVRQNVERTSAEAASSLEFLRGQLPQVRKDLESAENNLSSYQTQAKSADISLETKALLDQIVALDTKISELKLQQAEMDRRFTRQHPAYQALLTQLSELQQKQKSLTNRVESLPETQQEVLSLTRDVQVGTEVYTQLLNRTQELDVMRAGTVGNVRVIDNADVDVTKPVKPKKALIVLIATLLGGFIGVAVALLRRALNRGVEDPAAIEQLGLPVYASVPLSPIQKAEDEKRGGKGRHSRVASLLATAQPTDLSIEALRSLRTSLHFAMIEAQNNRLMISGPSPEVGKTFVSSNLAAVVAQAGQRVLLIDVDMRKGYLHKVFDLDMQHGLSDVLAKRVDFGSAVKETSQEGLYLLPRGQIPPNPSELLMHPNFSELLEQASNLFDMVILDTPPLLAVTDAAIVGRQAGTSLIVARFGKNPLREIELTQRRFAQNGIEIKGAILNGVEKRASAAYGYGYGYYHYEYKSDKN